MALHSEYLVSSKVMACATWILYTEDHPEIYGEEGDTSAKETFHYLMIEEPHEYFRSLYFIKSEAIDFDLVDFLRKYHQRLFASE